MLAVTIPDLKPSSQDTSAFYLENIYQLLANSNVSVGSDPSTLAKPPPFSPPRYIILVNLLWLMALVMSLSGATFATLEREFISHHILVTQNEEHPPETRARIHAMLVGSNYDYFKLRRVFSPLSILHYSLFIFFQGLLVYFYNIHRPTFGFLLMLMLPLLGLYMIFAVTPVFQSPGVFTRSFSPFIFTMQLVFLYAISRVTSWIAPRRSFSNAAGMRYNDVMRSYAAEFNAVRGKLEGEVASKLLPQTDTEVLGRMLLVIDDDHALEGLFDTIPGFCDSGTVYKPLDSGVTASLQQTLDVFLDRTFSSHLVTESLRNRRLITCLDAAHSALGPSGVSQILGNFFNGRRDEALKSVEIGHSLVRWGHRSDDPINPIVRRIVACIIARAEDHDGRWVNLVEEEFDIPHGDIQGYAEH